MVRGKSPLQKGFRYGILLWNGGGSLNAIIKWPGGKSRELDKIKDLIPDTYDRYVEPFFGGGALYFDLMPKKAAINDISASLMDFYRLVKVQDAELQELLLCYNGSFQNLLLVCEENADALLDIFARLQNSELTDAALLDAVRHFVLGIQDRILSGFDGKLLLSENSFFDMLVKMAADKLSRTVANHAKKPFSEEDLRENLITGFMSGYYMYFRGVYNDIALGRLCDISDAYKAANFYFIREYCYGSMFRYNAKGEFNIPYGGMSYNRKDMMSKINHIFDEDVARIFARTEICSMDFESFFDAVQLTEDDFMFLDPPYDTEFSDYEGKCFNRRDQERLAEALKKTQAKFILVIKNTDFIYGLYHQDFSIFTFDKQYTYNVRSRNERGAEHLIITNLPV
jgi:DNA adenine methylase